MADNAIQISTDEAARLAPRLRDEVVNAAKDAQPYLGVITKNRELLNDAQPVANPRWAGACELFVPFVKQAKLSLVSHIVPILLGPDPVLHVEATGAKYKEMSDEVESYLHAQLTRQCEFLPTLRSAVDASLRDGVSIVHTYWKKEAQAVQGAKGDTEKVYDAPRFDLIEIDKFGTFPAVNADIQDSPGVYVRYPITGAAIKSKADAGYFDKETAYDLLKLSPPDDVVTSADNTQKGLTTSQPVSNEDHLAHSYEITQIYYRGALDGGKVRDWLIFLYEPSNLILRCKPSPWFHGRRPFDAITPYRGTKGYFGDSIATSGGGQTQLSLTTIFRQVIDATSIGIFPEMIVDRSLKETIADIKKRRGPGEVMPVSPNFFEGNKIQPFAAGGFHPTSALNLIEPISRVGNEGVGKNDAMNGVPNPGNVTATEAEQIIEGSQKITAYITENIAESISRIGQTALELNQQFCGNAGPKALWAEVNEGRKVALKQAMAGTYRVSASGVRDTQNKGVLAKRAMERVQLLAPLPQVAQNPTRLYALLYDTLQATGTQDPTRYIGTQEEWQQEAMQAQQQAHQQQQAAQAQGPQMPVEAPVGAMPQEMAPMGMQDEMMPQEAPQSEYPPELLMVADAVGIPPEQLTQNIMQMAQQQGVSPDEILAQAVAQLQAMHGGQA